MPALALLSLNHIKGNRLTDIQLSRMKRNSSLISRRSSFNSNVALFETSEAATIRRSKRLKVLNSSETLDQAQVPLAKSPPSSDVDEGFTVVPPKVSRKRRVAKAEVKSEEKVTTASASGPHKPKKDASPRKPKRIPTALETPHPAPPRWAEAYDTIKRMRAHIVAPVDTMGCDQAQNKETDPKVNSNGISRHART